MFVADSGDKADSNDEPAAKKQRKDNLSDWMGILETSRLRFNMVGL